MHRNQVGSFSVGWMNERDVQRMISHCVGSAPESACGILTVGGVVLCENVARDARDCFDIRPEVIDKIPLDQVRGFFHSHVNQPAIPTARDLLGANWYGYVYCILGIVDEAARGFGLYRLDGTPAEKIFTRIILRDIWDLTK